MDITNKLTILKSLFIMLHNCPIASAFYVPSDTNVTSNNNTDESRGFYFGLIVPAYNTINGNTFDGSWGIWNQDKVTRIPKIGSGIGFGITIGWIPEFKSLGNRFSTDISYITTDHEIDYYFHRSGNDIQLYKTGDATYHILNFNIRFHPVEESDFKAYLLFNTCYSRLILYNSGINFRVSGDAVIPTSIFDGALNGIGYGFGAGISLYFHPKVALNFDIIYRITQYYYGTSANLNTIKDNSFSSNGININTGFKILIIQ
jgi:hypothetical protein